MSKKYAINPNGDKLHIIGECRFTKPYLDPNWKTYFTLDEVIADKSEYYSKCKLCFKNK